jgi:hypothetical protein
VVSDYLKLWQSGALAKAASSCRTVEELARRFGVSWDALSRAHRRLRDAGHDLAAPSQLLGARAPQGPRMELLDEWDQPTNPGLPSFDPPDDPPAEELHAVDEHRLRREVRELKERNKALVAEMASLQDQLAVVAEARTHTIDPIRPRERTSGLREGTLVVLASDWHVEEEVKPEKVQGRNRFNLDIARHRMSRFFEAARWTLESERQRFAIRDMCLWIGGDMMTNYLHADNIESNQLSPAETFAFLDEHLSAGIQNLLDTCDVERLVVPMNDGNHGRLTKELRAATRTENSLETLLYATIASRFRREPRVQFEIAQGDHLYTNIYDFTVRWTHGAEVKYGGGVGGVMIPLYKAMARWQTVRHAHLTCVGHFHQLTSLADLVINGSLIGYGPYSLRIGARFEPPQQAAFVVDSRRGKSTFTPLWVSDGDEDEAVRWAS